MSRCIRNNRGAGLLMFVSAICVVSVVTTALISESGLNLFRNSQTAVQEWETNVGNQKALALGGYLIAHNLVLCREQGWDDLSKTKHCRWGGEFHNPRIDMSKYGITDLDYKDDNLVLEITNNEEQRVYTTNLTFSLVDWSKDDAFRALVGNIPIWNELSDDDRFVVFMSASTDLKVSESEIRKITKSGAIRRPIGTPNLQLRANTGKESCIFECTVGDVLTPNPECRGPLEAPPEGADTTIGVRVANLGPGAIYRLKYERKTSYNHEVYPNKPDEKAGIEVLGTAEVFMPGEKLDVEVSRKCYSPQRVTQTQVVNNNVSVESTGGVGSTTTTTSSSTSVSVVSSFKRLSSESFEIYPSRFDPALILDPNFLKKYNPYNEATYSKNETLSMIEPKRLGTSLASFEVSSPQETILSTVTTTTTTVTVRPRPEPASSDGDGDGDN